MALPTSIKSHFLGKLSEVLIRFAFRSAVVASLVLFAALTESCGSKTQLHWTEVAPGLAYTNHHVPGVPWSIHVARVDRSHPGFEFHSTHARSAALGLSTLSEQVRSFRREDGVAVLALNGDFYQRDKDYAGDPRGLQIARGELISAPVGGVSFWVDAAGLPHLGNVVSRFQAVWPDGTTSPVGLNEERRESTAVVYTPSLGTSTHTQGGTELVLEPAEANSGLPLRIGTRSQFLIREIHSGGNSPIVSGRLVLSLGPALVKRIPPVKVGDRITLSTETSPALGNSQVAISGGPILLQNGRRTKLPSAAQEGSESYEFRSMLERHPRSAIGWNATHFFWVEVDGRQSDLSVGMTLEELAEYMSKLGCDEAMNLDGGGSATFWLQGQVRNSPCDKKEREIANGLVLVQKLATATSGSR